MIQDTYSQCLISGIWEYFNESNIAKLGPRKVYHMLQPQKQAQNNVEIIQSVI